MNAPCFTRHTGQTLLCTLPAQERAHAVLGPGLAFRPARTPPPAPRASCRSVPSGGSGPEGRRAVGPVCGELAPTLPAFRPAGSTTLLTTRGGAQRRSPASPACLSAARASLSFHWALWPSITEAGGRACALSAAIATACLERASERARAAEGRAAVAPARAGARVGDMVSAVGPRCCFQLTAFRVRIFGYKPLVAKPGDRDESPFPFFHRRLQSRRGGRAIKRCGPGAQRPLQTPRGFKTGKQA